MSKKPPRTYIDWPEVIKKYRLEPDGYAIDLIGDVPVFKVPFPTRYDKAKISDCSAFIKDQPALLSRPVAWIYRVDRDYYIGTNLYHLVHREIFVGYHPKTKQPLFRDDPNFEAVQYGPYKSLHTAIKQLGILRTGGDPTEPKGDTNV